MNKPGFRQCGGLLLALLLAAAVPPSLAGDQTQNGALHEARRNVFDPAVNAVSFRNMAAFFPTETVAHGMPWLPERRLRPLAVKVSGKEAGKVAEKAAGEGGTRSLDEALAATFSNALLVIHRGAIVNETYLNGSDPGTRFTSFSMSKSITSMLVGAAIERGHIASVDETLDHYLPELRGSAYEGVTIRQALLMRSGVDFDESYNFGEPGDLAVLFERALVRNDIRFSDISVLDLERAGPAGGDFLYSTLESCLLGRVVVAATGMRLAAFTEQSLWLPAGMEATAHWILDGALPAGEAFAGGGFNATLRDYGRLGQLMLNEGRANGRQVLSREWVRESTVPVGTEPARPGRPQGYQYQWWTLPDSDAYMAKGIHGQFIYIDPASETVIVKASFWPVAWDRELEDLTLAMFEAIVAGLHSTTPAR